MGELCVLYIFLFSLSAFLIAHNVTQISTQYSFYSASILCGISELSAPQPAPPPPAALIKEQNKIFLICKEIQSGAVAKSYMRKSFLIYEEMRKYLVIYEEAVSHI